jgi:hypothetical protein
MSSSNYRRNKAAIDRFRKELKAELEDLSGIDKKVMNQAVNEGVAFVKRRTPVGKHPNPVTFVVKNGPHIGEEVSFHVSNPGVGGFLRKSWHKLPTTRVGNSLETELINRAEYASFWNYGHRIVNKKGGPTKGFIKGTYVLEKGVSYVNSRMAVLFQKEVERIRKEYDG